MTRAWLIVNPVAGQNDWAEKVTAAQHTFATAGWDLTVKETAKAGDAITFAREAVADHVDVVVVAGGDGTVNEALQSLAGQRITALAVLPGGTVNVWATELGAKEHQSDIAQQIAQGRRHTVDVGRVNDRYFLMMASIGFDAATSAAVAESGPLKRLKRLAGPVAYGLAAVRTLFHFRGRRVSLTINGVPVSRRVLMVVIGNTRLYGGIAEITFQAHADDGLLDLCVLGGRGPLDLLHRFWSVLRRQYAADSGIDYRQVQSVVVGARHPLPIQADGEDIGTTPATFAVIPDALGVILLTDSLPSFLGSGER